MASAASSRTPLPAARAPTLGTALAAAAVAVVVSALVGMLVGLPTAAALFGDQLTVRIPLPLFAAMLRIFGPGAKHIYYGILLVGQTVLTAAAGHIYVRLRGAWPVTGLARQVGGGDVPILVVACWLVAAGLLAPLCGGGLFGVAMLGGPIVLFLALALPNLVFAVAFISALRRAAKRPVSAAAVADTRRFSRRAALRRSAIGLLVVAGGAAAWELLSSALSGVFGGAGPQRYALKLSPQPTRIEPPPTPDYGPWSPVAGQTAEVTPTAQFYYVSKNLVGDPTVDASTWRLPISGLVSAPYALSYAELRALPSQERYQTLECISNEVAGDLISNAKWTGVALADVLNRAGIQRGANEVIFRAADGYSDRLHLSQALDPAALIAYHINGVPLPQAHGFPARLLVPGLYGMKNGKWLTALEVGAGEYTGYWEARGWTAEAYVKLTSRIDTPHNGDLLLARRMYIAGIAFSGAAGIARVDVSTDAGQSWSPATLRRPLGSLTWVLWQLAWAATAGPHVITVRAIDRDGNVQTPAVAPTLPDGASGYDAIQVSVQ